MFSTGSNEDISTIQATEETNYSVEPLVNLAIRETLEALSKFVVAISGHIVRCHILLVHEVLEGYIAILLELDVVLEGIFN
jgi:hypothetical protein